MGKNTKMPFLRSLRGGRENALELRLRAERPRPPARLLQAIVPRDEPTPRRSALAPALAAGLTIALAAGLLVVGGASYAASALTHAARAVAAPRHRARSSSPRSLSSGGDQYRPGFGFGDPNHTHDGPPGVEVASNGEKAPPIQPKPSSDRKASLVTATITIDEQAALYFSVLDSHGRQLLLTQKGTKIGGPVSGPQTKTIHYVMLIPRTITFRLRVPANLLASGRTYRIRVIAVGPHGDKTRILIPFAA